MSKIDEAVTAMVAKTGGIAAVKKAVKAAKVLPYWYTPTEAERLINYASTKGVKVVVNHTIEREGQEYLSLSALLPQREWYKFLADAQDASAAKGQTADPRMCDVHGGSSIW